MVEGGTPIPTHNMERTYAHTHKIIKCRKKLKNSNKIQKIWSSFSTEDIQMSDKINTKAHKELFNTIGHWKNAYENLY